MKIKRLTVQTRKMEKWGRSKADQKSEQRTEERQEKET